VQDRAQASQRSYAVLWRVDGGEVRPGKLELGPESLRLENGTPDRQSVLSIRFADLVHLRMTRNPTEAVGRRPTMVLEQRSGATIALTAIDPLMSVHDLLERVAEAMSVAAE